MKITASTIEDALVDLAFIMERDGDDHTLLFEHLEAELAKLSKPQAAILRARQIVMKRERSSESSQRI